MQRPQHLRAIEMQAFLVDLGVILHHVAQGGEGAVVHVRGGEGGVAKPRHAEFAEVAMLELDVPRRHGAQALAVVVVAPEEVVGAFPELAYAAMPAGVDYALGGEERNSGIGEFPVAELRSEVAQVAPAFADEEAQAALRWHGIT